MPLYSVETELSTDESCCADFEGGGGHVSVRAITDETTTVNLETREWDYHVKQFMRQLQE
jgi:hypothetical protein